MWDLVYDFEGKLAWLWPHGQIPPSNLSSSADGDHRGVGVSFGFDLTGAATTNAPAGEQPAQRSVPPTRYADVLGQNAAVEAARDLIELPLKHADLFLRIGANEFIFRVKAKGCFFCLSNWNWRCFRNRRLPGRSTG
jgi:hypothetical protein